MTGFNVYRVPTRLGRALVAWPIVIAATAVLLALIALAALWDGAVSAAQSAKGHWRETRTIYPAAADALFFRGSRHGR